MSSKITDLVRSLAEPIAQDLGLRLWDVQFVKEGASWYLRIFIDKDGGVTIDDCVNMNNAIDPLLDQHDPISHSYYLEVSSPGLGRRLTRDEHFHQLVGSPVIARLYKAADGKREIKGNLASYDGKTIGIETEDGIVNLEKSAVSFVKLDDDY